jgi:ubiquinone/menaquinone biosynthesis C-methylase UbiE
MRRFGFAGWEVARMDKVAEFAGGIPFYYDRELGPVLFAEFAGDLARRVAALQPMRVLEMAAGTGIVTRQLRDALPSGARLVATDLNQPMLDVAKTKFHSQDRVDFQTTDATSLPFADGSFDAVACQFGVMFFPDKETSYREVHRVLAPRGCYVFNVMDSLRHNPAAQIATRVIGSFFPNDPPPFYRTPFGYYRLDPIKDALTEAGFSDITISVVTENRTIADPAAFAHGLVFGTPVIEQIRARGGVDPNLIADALADAFRTELGSNPCRTRMRVIILEARRG